MRTMSGRSRRSPVWRLMERKGDYYALCLICDLTFKFTHDSSNLTKHLKRMHPIEYQEAVELKMESSTDEKTTCIRTLRKRAVEPTAATKTEKADKNRLLCQWPKPAAAKTEKVDSYNKNRPPAEEIEKVDTYNNYRQLSQWLGPTAKTETEDSQNENTPLEPWLGRVAKRSPVWRFMEQNGAYAHCCLCNMVLKFHHDTSNLTKHMKRKHGAEYAESLEHARSRKLPPSFPENLTKSETVLPTFQENSTKSKTSPSKHQESSSINKPAPATAPPAVPATLEMPVKYKDNSYKKYFLDKGVLHMITKDLQPLSLVEDKGFVRLVHHFHPRYELPSQQDLERKLFPQIYEETRKRILQELMNVKEVAISTEMWTSQNEQVYLTVSCHFVTGEWDLKTYVLQTFRLTSVNILEELINVMTEWNIRHKVCAVVTSSDENLVAAVEQLGLIHILCFVHTLHLVVTEAIRKVEQVTQVQQKVRLIVDYFHTYANSAKILEDIQKSNGQGVKKLIRDSETTFNSTFSMLRRYDEEAETIAMALCLLDRNDLCLVDSENIVIKDAIAALEPYEQITEELSSEKFTALSKVLPIIHSLRDYYCFHYPDIEACPLAAELLNQLNLYFPSLEESFPIAASTYVDPRFKKFAFTNEDAVKQAEDKIITLMQLADADTQEIILGQPIIQIQEVTEQVKEATTSSPKGLWTHFDTKISKHVNMTSQTLVRPHLDIRRFNEERPVPRNEDPLKWWKENETLLPKLQGVAKGLLCIPATSVPTEHLFSTDGEELSQRRSNISSRNVNKMLFLNQNY